jgi:DNA repair ATPase RecN
MADSKNLIDDLDAEEKALNDKKKILEVKKKILNGIDKYDNDNFRLFNSYKEILDNYHKLQKEINDYLASIVDSITTVEIADMVGKMMARVNKVPKQLDRAYSNVNRIISRPILLNELQRDDITGFLRSVISPITVYADDLSRALEYEYDELEHDFDEFKVQIDFALHRNN